MKYYLAIDIGASSGRHIIGYKDKGQIKTEEVYRFLNGNKTENGHFVWDTEHIFNEIVNGLAVAFKKYPKIESLAIDTWGVDYALIKDGKPLYPIYAYRDSRTENSMKKVHEIISEQELFSKTGIAIQSFNTIYQLYDDKLNGRLEGVSTFLMLPEFFSFLLTGNMKKEYTMATTTGLINAQTKEFDGEIIDRLGLPKNIFGTLKEGGETVGNLKPEIAEKVNGNTLVKLCLSHDTASAFYAIDENGIYISSGTWSLLGLKEKVAHTDENSRLHGFTNEGGLNRTFRFIKNISGMWMVNNVCKENGINPVEFSDLAESSDYEYLVDVNDEVFFAPDNMTNTVLAQLKKKGYPAPKNLSDITRCVLRSIAKCYSDSVKSLEKDVNKTYDTIVIFGGGAKNKALNKFTEQLSGKKVLPIPIEATSIGNIKIQMES